MRVRTGMLILLAVLTPLALGCENENYESCQGFAAYYQALPCAGGALPDVDCNAFADYPCLIKDHFTCLEQAHTCNEQGGLDVELTRQNPDGTTYTCAERLACD